MAHIFAQGFAAVFMIAFGLIALYPLFLNEDTNPAPAPKPANDDVVLQIRPTAAFDSRPVVTGNQPFPITGEIAGADASRRSAA